VRGRFVRAQMGVLTSVLKAGSGCHGMGAPRLQPSKFDLAASSVRGERRGAVAAELLGGARKVPYARVVCVVDFTVCRTQLLAYYT
jgi:hypothetical protein